MPFASVDDRRAYEREYRKRNRDKVLAKQRLANKRFRELHGEQHRAYDRLNQAQRRAARTPEQRAHDARKKLEYQRANPHVCRSTRNNYRARKMCAEGEFTGTQFKALCEMYGNKCLCCKKIRRLSADHVVPLSKGGTNYISNIQPLCRNCNSRKHDRHVDYRHLHLLELQPHTVQDIHGPRITVDSATDHTHQREGQRRCFRCRRSPGSRDGAVDDP